MYMGMNLDCCDSIHAPVPNLLVSLGIYVDLGHEVLDITLVLDGQDNSLEGLSQGRLTIDVGPGSLYL